MMIWLVTFLTFLATFLLFGADDAVKHVIYIYTCNSYIHYFEGFSLRRFQEPVLLSHLQRCRQPCITILLRSRINGHIKNVIKSW
jgi:hypothetical protein